MRSLLIKDTTKEERMAIIEESVGGDAGGCDGCSAGILKMYEPYIEGEMELRECNMAFRFPMVSTVSVTLSSSCTLYFGEGTSGEKRLRVYVTYEKDIYFCKKKHNYNARDNLGMH